MKDREREMEDERERGGGGEDIGEIKGRKIFVLFVFRSGSARVLSHPFLFFSNEGRERVVYAMLSFCFCIHFGGPSKSHTFNSFVAALQVGHGVVRGFFSDYVIL